MDDLPNEYACIYAYVCGNNFPITNNKLIIHWWLFQMHIHTCPCIPFIWITLSYFDVRLCETSAACRDYNEVLSPTHALYFYVILPLSLKPNAFQMHRYMHICVSVYHSFELHFHVLNLDAGLCKVTRWGFDNKALNPTHVMY